MNGTAFTDDTVVELHPLHIGGFEDGGHEVGRADTGVFVALPAEGVDLLRLLDQGLPLGDVKRRFEAAHGEEPDLESFLEGMAECGFVRRVDGRAVADEAAGVAGGGGAAGARGWRLLADLAPERVGWLRSKVVRVVAVLVWLAAPAALMLRPDLVPGASDAWLHHRVGVNAAALTLLAWALVFLHELAHLVAVRALACTGALTLSHRLHFLVAQTDMSGVRTQPRSARYGPYLAGMTCDMAILLACLVARAAGADSTLPATVAYLVTVNLLFQTAFFMRTDVYFVFSNWLRLADLMGDTRRWLANAVHAAVGRPAPHDLSGVPARELRIVRRYAVFCAVGVTLAVGEFVLLGLPVMTRFLSDAVEQLGAGPTSLAFWDAAALVAVSLGQLGLLAAVMWRDRRQRAAVTGPHPAYAGDVAPVAGP